MRNCSTVVLLSGSSVLMMPSSRFVPLNFCNAFWSLVYCTGPDICAQ